MNEMTRPASTGPSSTGSATISDADDPLWYKDAVIYQLHVKSFFDSNNDGIGDFAGLMQKLDYIADLGVTAIWLLPFYPSPRRDDGYDIGEYRDVSPDYGTIEEARAFIDAAHERGLRVITELVINHTVTSTPGSRPRARRRRAARSATSTSGRTTTSSIPARASSSSTRRSRTGPGTRRRAPISGTASTRTSRTSTSTIPRCWRKCSP